MTTGQPLPDEIAAQIGTTFDELSDTVEAGQVRRYIQAMGDSALLYVGANQADGVAIAPPLFLQALARQPAGTLPPGADGLGGPLEHHDAKLPLKRAVVAGGEWELFRPVRVGERIWLQTKITDIRRTTGRLSGEMYIVTKETTYRDAAGEIVAVWRHQRVRR